MSTVFANFFVFIPDFFFQTVFGRINAFSLPLLRCFMHAKAAPQAFARGAALFN
jgi:hypothetical protein